MAKIAFLSLPQYGHVFPQMPIVAELVRRGHQVTVFNEPRFEAASRATGAAFIAYPEVFPHTAMADALTRGDLVHWLQLLLTLTGDILGPLTGVLDRDPPDIVVFDGLAVWGEIIATRLRVPSVSISTAFIFAALDDPTGKPPPIAKWMFSLFRLFPQFVTAWLKMARFGARNLPWRMPFIPRQGKLTLVLTSKAVHPRTPLLESPRFAFVGACIEPGTRTEQFDFARLDGRPLIYVSLGTVLFTNRRFFETCVAAFADFPGQVLLSVGPGTDLGQFSGAPENFIFAHSLPQLDILQRTAVFVTHAGLNSMQEALWYGVPMVAVPQTPEQARNAAIASQAGAAIALEEEARQGAVTAAQLRSAVEAILKEPRFRSSAADLGRSLREAGGYIEAANRIEAVAGLRPGTAPGQSPAF